MYICSIMFNGELYKMFICNRTKTITWSLFCFIYYVLLNNKCRMYIIEIMINLIAMIKAVWHKFKTCKVPADFYTRGNVNVRETIQNETMRPTTIIKSWVKKILHVNLSGLYSCDTQ